MALSNFYNDFSFTDNDFVNLTNVYGELMTAINEYASQIKNNATISKIETYRYLPLQSLSIKDAMYSLNAVLENINVAQRLSLNAVSLQDKIARWNNDILTDDQKIDALNFLGYYIQLSTKRYLQSEKEYNVIDLTLNQKDRELIRNYEYYVRNNRIYLLRSIADATQTPDKDFTLRDISIDYNTTEQLIGKDIQMTYSDALTRNEYSEIVKAFVYAALGGPLVSNLRSVLSSITGFSQVQIFDKYTRNLANQKMFASSDSLMSGYDFVVSFPAEYAVNSSKLDIMTNYIKLIKPAYAKFMILTNSYYDEYMNYTARTIERHALDHVYELLSDAYPAATKIVETVYSQRLFELIAENQFKKGTDEHPVDKFIVAVPDIEVAIRYWSETHVKDAAVDNQTDSLSHTNWDDPIRSVKIVENLTEATYNRNDETYELDKAIFADFDTAKKAAEGIDVAAKVSESGTDTYSKVSNEISASTTITDVSLPSYTNIRGLLSSTFKTAYFGPKVQVVNY